MSHILKSLDYSPVSSTQYPFSIGFLKKPLSIKFTTPITFFIGNNGTGKSTLLESIAKNIGLPTIGEYESNQDYTMAQLDKLAQSIKLSFLFRTKRGFFMRSEDVFGFKKKLDRIANDLVEDSKEIEQNIKSEYGKKLALGAVLGQKHLQDQSYDGNLDARSHGETFLKILEKRLIPNGLYLLDEPETPLSFTSQLQLVHMLRDAVKKGSQFVIATHSPILTAMKEATIYSFEDKNINKVVYEDILQFSLLKRFLKDPTKFI